MMFDLVSCDQLLVCAGVYQVTIGFSALSVTFRGLKFAHNIPVVHSVGDTFSLVVIDISLFMLMIGVLFIGFGMLFNVMFCTSMAGFEDIGSSMFSMFRGMFLSIDHKFPCVRTEQFLCRSARRHGCRQYDHSKPVVWQTRVCVVRDDHSIRCFHNPHRHRLRCVRPSERGGLSAQTLCCSLCVACSLTLSGLLSVAHSHSVCGSDWLTLCVARSLPLCMTHSLLTTGPRGRRHCECN